jgi:hypothetical protein
MAGEIVTKSKRFYCVSIVPDFCRTPIGPSAVPVPYMIIGEFCEATGVSRNITSNGEPVVIHASTVIPTVKGDEPGIAKGIKSNTVGGRVQHMEKSSTLSFNGERAVRVGDLVYMNDKNTIGKVFERLDAPASKDFPEACEPGGTLAVLKAAAKSRNFIPQAFLNFVSGAPLVSPALSAACESASATQSNGEPTSLATPNDGGVSRGRGTDLSYRPVSTDGASSPGVMRGIGSRGVRNAEILTPAQEAQLYMHVKELGLNSADFRISSHVSAYSDNWDVTLLGPNMFPATRRSGRTVFEKLTPRSCIAHEAGHMLTTRAGTSFEPASLYDEVNASLTGRELPGLNSVERYQLLRDAAERSRNEGRVLRDVLKEMKGR